MVTRLLQIFFSKFEFLRLDPNHPIRGLDVAEENSFPYVVLHELLFLLYVYYFHLTTALITCV